ncbi:MAG TPA: hypothetical protein VGI80_01335 [Pyrinomonadaceae bacterium]
MPITLMRSAEKSGDGRETTSPRPKERQTNAEHERAVVDLLRRNIASIKSEVKLGTKVDTALIAEMEADIDRYEHPQDTPPDDVAK